MPIPTLGFGHDCFPCPMRGCAYTLCNWSRVNFLCLTMKNSFQRAGCEAHKSGNVELYISVLMWSVRLWGLGKFGACRINAVGRFCSP